MKRTWFIRAVTIAIITAQPGAPTVSCLAQAGVQPSTHSPAPSQSKLAPANAPFTNVLYGAAYYHEYMPYERLDQDVKLMKEAGITVVRVGESTWSLWEPQDGQFEYAWMDRVVDAMGKAGIKVIMGTPTYSIPTWMYHAHPEVLARPTGGAQSFYGMRQNMDTDSPAYRFYAERLIRKLVEHYKDNPAVIGWQVDNETNSYGATNHDVFVGFTNHLKQKFGTTEALNKAWGLNYWGEDVNGWENLPTRDNTVSTGYKLEWSRWSQMRVTDFLAWQAAIVREYRRPDQFVTTDYGGIAKRDVNEFQSAKVLDVVADNPYHGTQDHMDGQAQAFQGDLARSLKHANYLVTETNAQTIGWDSTIQFPPYDGQLRLDVYTHLSSGANMVEYWHWASIPSGQEVYWKGVLGHDLEPNRAYAEVSKTAHELNRIGTHLVNLDIENQVAILYSVDSANGLDFMPLAHQRDNAWPATPTGPEYSSLMLQLHRSLYQLNVGTDFVFADDPDFSRYKVLIVPALYVADDALLQKISSFVKSGGHVLMTFKSGFTNENNAVRWVRAPGPLRAAAGFSYQEFSNLEKPVALKDDPFHAGAENQVSYWAEFLMQEHAKALAYYDHPFFGQWPAITENQFGSGSLTYEGTFLTDALQKDMVLGVLKEAGLTGPDQSLPGSVHVKHGVNSLGRRVHYYLNYSSDQQTAAYAYATGSDLTTGAAVLAGQNLSLKPWDLAIVEEK